jgi:hypothetical protein
VSGPFETERDALAVAAPYEGGDGNRAMLLDAANAAGVVLGEYDRAVIDALAGQPPGTCAVVASLIVRAAEPKR